MTAGAGTKFQALSIMSYASQRVGEDGTTAVVTVPPNLAPCLSL